MEDEPDRQLVLYKNNFGVWELNPEGMGLILLKISATGGNNFGWGPPWLGEAGPCPHFQLYPDICLTTEEKNGKSVGAENRWTDFDHIWYWWFLLAVPAWFTPFVRDYQHSRMENLETVTERMRQISFTVQMYLNLLHYRTGSEARLV
jgi:hypothetical protein